MFAMRTLLVAGLFLLAAPLAVADDKRAADDKPFDDATFVSKAGVCNLMEIEAGRLAVKQARNEDVKKFAQKMIDDHTQAQEELKKIAASASWNLPEKMDEEHQKKCDAFKDYKGENFDRDYMKCMVEGHEMAVKELTRATKEAKNSDLRNFATKYLPIVERHLEKAKAIQDAIK